ncbi:MAG: hypothetical protein ABUK01_17235 [Leptospirales bacterium]
MKRDWDNEKGHEERNLYSKVLRIFLYIGFVFLTASFLVYIFELLPNRIPIEKTAELLKLRASEYAAQSSVPTGWNWIHNLQYGDIISFSGIVVLAIISFSTYFVIFFSYLKSKNHIFATLVFVQLLIFLAAAFGVSTGH